MRTTDRTFERGQVITAPIQATTEKILSVYKDALSSKVSVQTGFYSDDDVLLGTSRTTITGDSYNLLMSDSPSFAPGKPEGEFRECDLWYIIDIIRSTSPNYDFEE